MSVSFVAFVRYEPELEWAVDAVLLTIPAQRLAPL